MAMLLPVNTPDEARRAVGSPLWLLYVLKARLDAVSPRLVLLDDYYHGNHPLPHVTNQEVRDELRHLLCISASNYMRVVVNAKKQRIRWQGVRLSDDMGAPDEQTWEMVQANDLEAQSQVLWQTALTQRRAYLSVWYPQAGDDPNYPVIRIESPTQCIVDHDPADRRRRRAALKVWVDDWTGAEHANVYLPDMIHKFMWAPADARKPYGRWEFREDPVPNPLGVVPIVPVVNQPTLSRFDGFSEIDDLIQIQDRINTTIFNRSVAEHFAAFRQKWATGLEVPVDEQGQPIQSFITAINQFWLNENPDGKFGQFEATDLANYGAAKESDVQDISVISGTPRHYFTVSGQAPSGDSMKSAEAALVASVVDFERHAAGALREVVKLARRVKGLDTPVDCEILWADPEYQTLGQLVDAHVKLYAANILPRRDVLEKLGYDPGQIARIEAAMTQAQLFADAAQSVIDTREAPGGAGSGTTPAG